MGMGTAMATDAGTLYRLMTWLSPSYPVGAFSHSHGLEWAVETGDVGDAAALGRWVEQILLHGGGRQDAILFALAHQAAAARDRRALDEVAALAAALNPSRERQTETLSQGRAFALATSAAWPPEPSHPAATIAPERLAYPVAVAAAAAAHGIPCAPALTAYLHAFASNLVSAGVRLIPLGQTDGQALVATLEAVIHDVAAAAEACGPDDLGGAALCADIASMRHETQYTRLFRT